MRTSTHKPVIPNGYTGRDFNNWIKYLKSQIDNINKPSVSAKLR